MVMATWLIRTAFGNRYATNEDGGQQNVGSLFGSEIRVGRRRQTDPLVLVMLNRIIGADETSSERVTEVIAAAYAMPSEVVQAANGAMNLTGANYGP